MNLDCPVTSGLVAYHDARLGVTLSSGQVTAVEDHAGAQDLSASAGAGPYYRGPGIDAALVYDQGATRTLSLPGTLSVSTRDYTQLFLVQTPDMPDGTEFPSVDGYTVLFGSAGDVANLFLQTSELRIYAGVGILSSGLRLPMTPAVVGLVGTSGALTVHVDDQSVPLTAAASATLTGGKIGAFNDGTFGFHGDILLHLLWDRALSAVELATVKTWMASRAGLVPTNRRTHVIAFDGDSLTYGYLAAQNRTYPMQTRLDAGATAYNVAQGSATIPARNTAAAGILDTLVRAGQTNILVFFCGANDLIGGTSAATVHANLATYCNARRAAGWDQIVVFTQFPFGSSYTNHAAHYLAFNTLVRANYQTYADALVDVQLDDRIGAAGAETDTRYRQADTVHLTEDGNAILASLVEAVLLPRITMGEVQAISSRVLTALPDVAAGAAGGLPLSFDSSGRVGANVVQWRGTTLPAEDTSGYPVVTVKHGTGVGEIDLTSGRAKADVTYFGGVAGTFLLGVPSCHLPNGEIGSDTIHSTALAAITASIWSYLSASATTAGSLGKRIVDYLTGDAFARLGAPAGASVSADIRAVNTGSSALASGTIVSTTGTTTTLDSGAVATANYYSTLPSRLVITGGTGAGQERAITAYSVSRVATHVAWTTNPTNSSTYAIREGPAVLRSVTVTTRDVTISDS